MIESALALGGPFHSTCIAGSRPQFWNCFVASAAAADDFNFSNSMFHFGFRRQRSSPTATRGLLPQPWDSDMIWNKLPRVNDGRSFMTKNNSMRTKVQAASDHLDSMSDPLQCGEKPCYHPFEEIGESERLNKEEARLTDAEMSRTIVEVNSKATLLFSGLANDEVEENIFLPELPYVTDKHGDIYFEVNDNEDILQILNAENQFVQVLVGMDNIEMLGELEVSGESEIDFGIEEITDEDSDDDDDDDGDYEKDWVAILEDEEDDLDDLSEPLGDWANLETMRSSHPVYFAKKMAKAAMSPDLDWMDQPSTGVSIQGFLKPACIEDQSIARKCTQGDSTSSDASKKLGNYNGTIEGVSILNGDEPNLDFRASSEDTILGDELEKDKTLPRTVLYKLEMINIHLVSAYANQSAVGVKDFRRARADILAHSAAKIISRVNSGGEMIVQSLKSLCWRSKGIQVEEATVIGVDSLGFDARVCSGTQIQTLRFAFNTRITSEYDAENQIYDLLFPTASGHQKPHLWQQAPHRPEKRQDAPHQLES